MRTLFWLFLVTQILFLAVNLTGIEDLSWAVTLAPTWIPVATAWVYWFLSIPFRVVDFIHNTARF